MSSNYLRNIAIVGAGGQFGKFITKALVKQGKHTITAITRADSKSTIPDGVHAIQKVDYDSPASLVAALKGNDALIITMQAMAGADAQKSLIHAAKDAGVKWIMPNEYGTDPAHNPQLANDTMLGPRLLEIRKEIETAGLSWVALSCGFWYEFSLAGTEARYGFDFRNKALTLFDDGNSPIPTSTWPQASLAVARIFALPIESDGKGGPALNDFRNRAVYVSSFRVSQRDMLASVLRVTGDKESDWTITAEPSKERYERGVKLMKEDLKGFAILLYTRVFFPDRGSDFSAKLNNKELGLPEESLDEATGTAIEMEKVSSGDWRAHW